MNIVNASPPGNRSKKFQTPYGSGNRWKDDLLVDVLTDIFDVGFYSLGRTRL